MQPFNDNPIRSRSIYLSGSLIILNIVVWLIALYFFHQHPIQLGAAMLAYSFGLRHGVDADHIAAIDNVTRKLMQQNRRSVSVGLYFSLGHSTIVILVSLAIVVIAGHMHNHFEKVRAITAVIGTSFSVLFLLLLAFMNILILRSTYQQLQHIIATNSKSRGLNNLQNNNPIGFSKWFSKLFAMISHSWQMYFIGFIFALSFDTATEIGLLSLTTAQATSLNSFWLILIYPALFTVAMMLVDTIDNILMLGVYGWAFVKPIRKIYYNLSITFISVILALLISGLQGLGLIVNLFNFSGAGWSMIKKINDHSSGIGFFIIGFFILSWLISILIYRVKQLDA